jgi:hypothetical protein
LNLTPAALAQELTVQYLPEECRLLADQKQQQVCVTQYKAYKPCWDVAVGTGRFACAQTALNLKATPGEDIRSCVAGGQAESTCKQQTRQKVFSMIKFRFYDLEERAEELIEQGVSREVVADFVVFITNKKNEFNAATNDTARKQIILDVRTGWQAFVKIVVSTK